MNTKSVLLTLLLTFTTGASAFGSDDPVLIQKLRDAKFTLQDAVAFAERTSGPATSAKFEMDGNQLVFSVYTAPQGLDASPEETDLTELAGSATALPIQGKAVVFTDKEHIARASVHMTLMQLSGQSLQDVINEALKRQPGLVFSVSNPMVRNHEAVADVSILTSKNKVVVVAIELQD